MSDTPRTDAVAQQCVGEGSPMSYVRAIDLARQLERELDAVAALAADTQRDVDRLRAELAIAQKYELWADLAQEVTALWGKYHIETDESLTGCIERTIDEWRFRALIAEATPAAAEKGEG